MRYLLVGIFVCWTALLSAAGMSVYPMEQFVRPGRPTTYTVTNSGSKAIAVEVFAETWSIAEDGEELREATKDLVIFPQQFILKGNTQRRVKVGTRSRSPITSEKAYRVTIRELPVSFEVDENQLNRVYMANAYRTSFYVQPSSRQASVELASSARKGARLQFALKNPGSVHTHLLTPQLIVETSDGKQHTLAEHDMLDPVAGQNLHAGIARRFVIDLDKAQLEGRVKRIQLSVENAQRSERQVFELYREGLTEEVIETPDIEKSPETALETEHEQDSSSDAEESL